MIAVDQAHAEAGYVIDVSSPWWLLAVIAAVAFVALLVACRPRPSQRRRDRSFARRHPIGSR